MENPPLMNKPTLVENSSHFYSSVMPSLNERKQLEKVYQKVFDLSNPPKRGRIPDLSEDG